MRTVATSGEVGGRDWGGAQGNLLSRWEYSRSFWFWVPQVYTLVKTQRIYTCNLYI